VLVEERRLPELDADAERLRRACDDCRAAVEKATERIDALPPQIDDVSAALAAAQVRAAGETEQRIYTLDAWRETPFFTDRERAALEWTEAVTNISQTHVPSPSKSIKAGFR